MGSHGALVNYLMLICICRLITALDKATLQLLAGNVRVSLMPSAFSVAIAVEMDHCCADLRSLSSNQSWLHTLQQCVNRQRHR